MANTSPKPIRSQNLPWRIGVPLVALVLALPVLVVGGFVLVPAGDVWRHLAETVLADYVVNSLLLMMGVAIGTLIGGVGTAWLTSMCNFPGRGLFEWALLLPMAMPAYIIAYTYTGLFDFTGPFQSLLRQFTGWGYGDYWFPEIRSLEGAALTAAIVEQYIEAIHPVECPRSCLPVESSVQSYSQDGSEASTT